MENSFNEVDLVQSSQEWLDWRHEHIGSSDAPPILGLSPYKTRSELWKEKQGLSQGQIKTYAMQRGNDLEPMIRQKMSAYLDCQCVTKVLVNKDRPWQAASVDGIDINRELVIEIKCANEQDHLMACNDIVPEKYYPQLQHILAVTGFNYIWYCSYSSKGDLYFFCVERNESFIENLITQEKEFWFSLQNFQKPEINEQHKEYTKEPHHQRNDPECLQLATQLLSLKNQIKELEQQQKNIKEKLILHCNHMNSIVGNIKITKVLKSGTVDYSAIMKSFDIKLNDSELDTYRRRATEYWMIEESI